MSRRLANFLTFGVCAGLMGYALYSEHVLGLYPCPLCIFQRMAVIGLGLIALIAALHNPKGGGRYVYAGLGAVIGGLGMAVAGRHVWLQSLPADQVPSCGGASLEYLMETVGFLNALSEVLTASGECAEVTWRFLSLSMPMWVLIALAGLVSWFLLANVRFGGSRRNPSAVLA
ncbi:MAG: disulfide bond formation protein B [Pseudomonadota bacterium]